MVVIGAGIAGLSAAHRLVQCGLCDVTILEATDRSATLITVFIHYHFYEGKVPKHHLPSLLALLIDVHIKV